MPTKTLPPSEGEVTKKKAVPSTSSSSSPAPKKKTKKVRTIKNHHAPTSLGEAFSAVLSSPCALNAFLESNNDDTEVFAKHLFSITLSLDLVNVTLVGLTELEIRKRESAMQLFRIDSVSTKYFSVFNKAVGSGFLHSFIGTFAKYSQKKLKSLDLDSINSEDPSARNISRRKVGVAFHLLLRMLVGTSPFLSPELKRACAALSGRVVHKFGNGSQRTFLVGYFFVRFLCPALAMPVLLGIETSKSLQKLMILMSKMLQAGASGQPFDSDQMKFANKFILEATEVVDLFLLELCSAPLSPGQKKMQQECEHEMMHMMKEFGGGKKGGGKAGVYEFLEEEVKNSGESLTYFLNYCSDKEDQMLRTVTEQDKVWPKTQTAACSYLTELHKMLETGGLESLNRNFDSIRSFGGSAGSLPMSSSPSLASSPVPNVALTKLMDGSDKGVRLSGGDFSVGKDTDDSEDTFSDFSLKSEPVTNDEKNKKRLRSFTSSKTMSSSTSTPSPPPSRPSNRRAPSLSSTLGGNEGTSRKDGGEDGDWGQQTSSKELLAYMSSRKGGKYGTISRIKQGVFPIAFSSPTLRLQDFEKGVPSNYKSSLPSESLKTSDWDGLWTFLSGLYPDNSVEILNFLACFGQVYDKDLFFNFLYTSDNSVCPLGLYIMSCWHDQNMGLYRVTHPELYKKIQEFMVSLKEILKKEEKPLTASPPFSAPPPPRIFKMASEKGGEVLQTLPDSSFTPKLFDNFEVDVLATSLTSAMYQIYLGVGPGEMHDGSWQGEGRWQGAPHLTQLSLLFNYLSFLFTVEVLYKTEEGEREVAVRKCVDLAVTLKKLGNLEGMAAVVSIFDCASLHRLKYLWKRNKKIAKKVKSLRTLLMPANEYDLYRKYVASQPTILIPFFAPKLCELRRLYERAKKIENGFVNYTYVMEIGKCINEQLQYRQYDVLPVINSHPNLVSLIESPPNFDLDSVEDVLYNRSLEILPLSNMSFEDF